LPRIPVVPRKGQILALEVKSPLFRTMIRWDHVYFVPRPGGELIVGATNEDAGFDRSITPAGVGRLLADAQQLSSHVGNLAIKEMWTGLRPATPDGLPVIGRAGVDGLIYATGHYRNGILLAPLTASAVGKILTSPGTPNPVQACSPRRFDA
jgi:glycine/D-amino acid oxidase-like deaminating enzyme